LQKLELGRNYIVRNIYFDNNTSVIKQESYKELKKLETLLKKNPGVKVEISAHTDSKGDDGYNKGLSQRRAEAVVKYLSNKGVPIKSVLAKGYGEERPLATNDDELEGRELNRRIEFEILEK
jgi:outer membrane protein OmpA-like peptidoglycan-associated protein